MADLRDAIRRLRKQPGSTANPALMVALGIDAIAVVLRSE